MACMELLGIETHSWNEFPFQAPVFFVCRGRVTCATCIAHMPRSPHSISDLCHPMLLQREAHLPHTETIVSLWNDRLVLERSSCFGTVASFCSKKKESEREREGTNDFLTF